MAASPRSAAAVSAHYVTWNCSLPSRVGKRWDQINEINGPSGCVGVLTTEQSRLSGQSSDTLQTKVLCAAVHLVGFFNLISY